MRAALFSRGDVVFVVGVLVAVICVMIAFIEWYENRNLGFALAFVGGALFALLAVWLLW